MNIHLAEDTISSQDLQSLTEWMLAGNRLTKGEQTLGFERAFSDYMGCEHAVFVNSGSSANLLMIYAMKELGILKNMRAIAPAVSWVTSVTPLMQLGFDVKLCECDKENLGIDPAHLAQLCEQHKPSLLILVHVLGHANHMQQILDICAQHKVLVIEDSCEAIGTVHCEKALGTLSEAGSFSFYYGHQISTIEGGMITTDNPDIYNIMLSLRSHGWSRDLSAEHSQRLAEQHHVDEIRNFYTFYYPGMNLRSTDLQAYLGLLQLQKLDDIVAHRQHIFETYRKRLPDFYTQTSNYDRLCSFAYGTLVANRLEVYRHLKDKGIETRPLICGNIGRHPFWVKAYGISAHPNADKIHDHGIYLPNHYGLTEEHVDYICDHLLSVAKPIGLT